MTAERQKVLAETLAAYALNLLYGAELEQFERDNLLALAIEAGAVVSERHRRTEQARVLRARIRAERVASLEAQLKARRSWWRFWSAT